MFIEMSEVFKFQSHTGKGISGLIGDKRHFPGSPSHFTLVPAGIDSLHGEGKTVMVFGTVETPLALVAVADEVRETSMAVIIHLHRMEWS
ncbi:hypothetical protein CN378_03580 [Bacillus sp. AFS015802]|uniref:hypothetical protein n=1 Tax=Bacillus sp. AFS015802 TaxID=2033486 RepID=UPI000BF296E2|nr:hypothetical protein [Bacillus sp. AFS015802]PFA69472.1 hypothetical protein CN378_03580 [Bacillus sp. AFS015802]